MYLATCASDDKLRPCTSRQVLRHAATAVPTVSRTEFMAFDLLAGTICVGDPVMGLARYTVALAPGRYTLATGALVSPSAQTDCAVIDLDGPYLYVVDASKQQVFEQEFHLLGNECS